MNLANKNVLKEVLEMKNKRNTNVENMKIFQKRNLKDSFDHSKNISFKKQIISDLSNSSSDFSSFFDKKEEKKFEKSLKYNSVSFNKSQKAHSKDLPRDKESFNKRKNLKESQNLEKNSHKNMNLLNLFEKTSYFLPHTRKKEPSPSETHDELMKIKNLDITNTIISIKNSMDYLRNPEKEITSYLNSLHLKQQKSQDKSSDQHAGKIVNQSSKLRNANETSAENRNNKSYLAITPRENESVNQKKATKKNYIDENKPNILKNKTNNINNHVSLAEKLKKEILLINEQDQDKKNYNLRASKKKHENNTSYIKDTKEQRSISLRRTMNGILETLSSDDEISTKKKHLQRKSLNPGYLMDKKPGKNEDNLFNKLKMFEKHDIEKIYKEYKNRKI